MSVLSQGVVTLIGTVLVSQPDLINPAPDRLQYPARKETVWSLLSTTRVQMQCADSVKRHISRVWNLIIFY